MIFYPYIQHQINGRNLGPKANIRTTNRLTSSPLELEVNLEDKDSNTDIIDIAWAVSTLQSTIIYKTIHLVVQIQTLPYEDLYYYRVCLTLNEFSARKYYFLVPY